MDQLHRRGGVGSVSSTRKRNSFIPGKRDTPFHRKCREFLVHRVGAGDVAFPDMIREIHAAGVDNTCIPGTWHWNAALNTCLAAVGDKDYHQH
jgi:hypothetical protein